MRIEEVGLPIEHTPQELVQAIAKILGFNKEVKFEYSIAKRAVDSRSRRVILFTYSVNVYLPNPAEIVALFTAKRPDLVARHHIRLMSPYEYVIPTISSSKIMKRPVVIGTGPAGIFCAIILAEAGCKPIVIERGKDVTRRIKDVDVFVETGVLNPESNIQYGEGGAGTFSDGKLYTLVNNPRLKFVFETFVKAGAPDEILWDAHPHIGTDILRATVQNMRHRIIELGGEVLFDSCVTDITIKDGKIISLEINNGERALEVEDVVLATGHSARDTYEMLYKRGLAMEQKVFSIGVRIEHSQEMINRCQYHDFYDHELLPTARYKLVAHPKSARPVYTFCMCPGGHVMAAASEPNMLVTNGMSKHAQDGDNSNSALLVNVFPKDFGSDHPLAGIELQRKWEYAAFLAGGSNYDAPAVLVGDFLNKKPSTKLGKVIPTYRPGIKLGSIDDCLPDYVLESLREALPLLDEKMKGFASPDAVITGVETRTTSPLRILRNDTTLESSVAGLYPAGEGGGYSGGITSSAFDGMLIAETIIKKYQ